IRTFDIIRRLSCGGQGITDGCPTAKCWSVDRRRVTTRLYLYMVGEEMLARPGNTSRKLSAQCLRHLKPMRSFCITLAKPLKLRFAHHSFVSSWWILFAIPSNVLLSTAFQRKLQSVTRRSATGGSSSLLIRWGPLSLDGA